MSTQLPPSTELTVSREERSVATVGLSAIDESPSSIFLLEDSKVHAILATNLLCQEMPVPPEIVHAERLDEAIQILDQATFDVVITDLNLPDSSGLATFRKVLKHAGHSPVIVLSAAEDESIAVAAVQEGAQDFILKDMLSHGILARQVRFAIERAKRLESHRLVEGILDSLPDHVAVLDAEGKIIAVNAAWKTFATNNFFIDDGIGVGTNYLQVCGSATEAWAVEAKIVADGIRSVLQGETSDFRVEYPCHSETEERWFQVRVHPFRAAGRARAIVSHENITDRKVNAASLKAKTRHLLAAGEVQKLLLPNEPPVIAGYKFAGALLPADETAGDYFDFIPVNAHHIAVAVADVSGHGIEAALVMAQLRGLLWALGTNAADPGQVLAQINPLLAHKSTQFITMFLGYLDTLTHSLVYAAAGHNGLIIRANGDVEELSSTTTPLGVLDSLDTDTISIGIHPGDVVILLTDGLEEATGTNSAQFGIQRVKGVIRASRAKPVENIVGELRRELRNHLGGCRQNDDVTIVVVKRDNV